MKLWTPPDVIGICPHEAHALDFYVPHGGKCPAEHYVDEGTPDLIEYRRVGEIAAWLRHVDRLDEIRGARAALPEHDPLWDAAIAIERLFG